MIYYFKLNGNLNNEKPSGALTDSCTTEAYVADEDGVDG